MASSRLVARVALGVAALTGLVLGPAEVGVATPRPGSASPSSGELTITISEPSSHTFVAAGTPVRVAGSTTGGGTAANLVYVVDTSGSTTDPGGDCGDPNVDGSSGTIIDCEVAGLTELTSTLAGAPASIGVVRSGGGAEALDLDPVAPGVQTSTGPSSDADGNGTPDVVDGLRGLEPGGAGDSDAALGAVVPLLVAGERNVVVFLSDGPSPVATGPGSALQAVADAGAVVLTYSVGPGGSSCGPGSELQAIADATGGACVEVGDPSQLPVLLPALNLVPRVEVEVEVNGRFVGATVDPSGAFSATLAPGLLKPGRNNIAARALDGDGATAVAHTHVIVRGGR